MALIPSSDGGFLLMQTLGGTVMAQVVGFLQVWGRRLGLGSYYSSGSALAIRDIWGVNQQVGTCPLFLPLAASQANK